MNDDLNTFNSSYWDVNVPISSTGTLKADSRVDFYGALTGGGTLNLSIGTGAVKSSTVLSRTTLYGNWSNFTGKINVITTSSVEGDFRLANANGYPKAAINLGPKVVAVARINSSGNYPIGELSGDASSTLSGVNNDSAGVSGAYTAMWSVGGRSTSATFAGAITDGGSPSMTAITKVGYGTWTLSGSCSYTGPTNVLAGTLRFTGTGSGSSSLAVGDGATLELAGNGLLTINGPVVNNVGGKVRLTGSGNLQTTGTFTNYGVLDLLTSRQSLPANFINQGIVLDSSAVRVDALTLSSSGAQLSVESYIGHNYQLQRSTSLVSGSWENIGAAQPGIDDVLILTDPSVPSGKGFYRVIVAP